MSNFYRIKIPLHWEKVNANKGSKNKLKIKANAYLRFHKASKKLYKPAEIEILEDSILTTDFTELSKDTNFNKGNNKMKEKKLSVIESSSFIIDNGFAYCKKNYNLYDNIGINGFVSAYGIICGGNQNRTNNCYVKSEYDFLNNIKLAEFFQDPEPYKGDFDIDDYEDIDIDSFYKEEYELLEMLVEYQFSNIKTCSLRFDDTPEITSNKNGQEIYSKSNEEIIKEFDKMEETSKKQKITTIFRKKVMDRFNSKCVICGIDVKPLLVASHIKAKCETEKDIEKIDPNNGLLLCAGHDKVFDRRLITFDSKGKIIISKELIKHIEELNLIDGNIPQKIADESKIYLKHHYEMFNKKNNH